MRRFGAACPARRPGRVKTLMAFGSCCAGRSARRPSGVGDGHRAGRDREDPVWSWSGRASFGVAKTFQRGGGGRGRVTTPEGPRSWRARQDCMPPRICRTDESTSPGRPDSPVGVEPVPPLLGPARRLGRRRRRASRGRTRGRPRTRPANGARRLDGLCGPRAAPGAMVALTRAVKESDA